MTGKDSMRPIGFAMLCATLLTACDSGPPTPTTKVQASTPYVDRLKALNELNRGLALRRAVQDAGLACKRVDRSGFQQDYRNMSMWTARCSDGGDYALFIAPNGDVQVRKCKDAATLSLPECRFEG